MPKLLTINTMIKKLIPLFTILIISSCGSDETSAPLALQGIQPNGQDQGRDTTTTLPKITNLRWYKTQWKKEWSSSLKIDIEETGIDSTTLSSADLRRLSCSGYKSASAQERQTFWIVFIASIAANESAFNPKLRYYEPSLKEYSEGLLQLSLSDKSSSTACRSLNRRTILTPSQNLRCGLSILQRQLRGNQRRAIAPGTLFPKKAYYWSVLTRPSSQTKVIDFFKSHLSQLHFCK